jgi:hypothetical protein
VTQKAEYFLIVDQEGLISCVPETRKAAERRLAELGTLHLRGSLGQRRQFTLVEVDKETHEAASMRRLLRYQPTAL